MAIAQGQFTIIDYNDALTLTGFINSNLSKTQMYNPDNGSYAPDWSTNNLVLTPSLFLAGSGNDIVASTEVQTVKWYEGTSTTAITTGGDYTLSGTKSHILTVKGNVMAGLPGKDYRCVISYRDSTTGLTLSYTTSISFSRVVNGSGIVSLDVTTPKGNIFKNGDVTSLTAKAELWRGSVVDSSSVTYQWYVQDPDATSGWTPLTNTENKYSGVTSDTLIIYNEAVNSYATFKCEVKDTDTTSPTYNNTFAGTASFVDMTDPISVVIESTGGSIFKNGVGSTTLTAKVYQAGEEIDTIGTIGTYKWSKYDKDGSLVTDFSKTEKSFAVGSSDVDVKATFLCEVTI